MANLVETNWLTRYPRSTEITCDKGSEFIGHRFRNSLIETEYGITSNPSTSENPTSNAILERVHKVLGRLVRNFNIKETYVDEDDPWSGISGAAEFAVISIVNILKGYILVQFVFGEDMILPIKHKVDGQLICQQKQMQINKDNIRNNNKISYHDYKSVDKVMLNSHAAYKYETPDKGPFVITQCWNNCILSISL